MTEADARRSQPVGTTAKVAHSRELWSHGKKRGALEYLKAGIRAQPSAVQLRLTLAEFYREMGCPDQAGRWGIVVDGWTTAIEQDRLARLLAPFGTAREDVVDFLLLPEPIDSYPDLRAVIDGRVEGYVTQPGEGETKASDLLPMIAVISWIVTVIACLLAMASVFVVAFLNLADTRSLARFIGGCLLSAGAVSFIVTSAATALAHRWGSTVSLCIPGVLCGTIAVNVFLAT